MRSAASIKDKLKNRSKETGKTMLELLTLYGLERTLYRLSVSQYRDNFILKGGMLLYACFEGSFSRATTDIDLLASRLSNDNDQIKEVFSEIFKVKADDPLVFDLSTLSVRSITEFKKYHGVSVSIVAYLDRTKIPVTIDVGYGDVVFPGRVEMEYPVILDDEPPCVFSYTICSLIAEKFEAVVSLGYDNSRFKDFYDIYILSNSCDFDGNELKEAVRETFEYRHTTLSEIVAFEDGYGEDPVRRMRWQAFIKKKKAMVSISLEDAINALKVFLGPIVESLLNDIQPDKTWDHMRKAWISN
ncbi:MAG: nucleotidyl transferase AbiEii/AbiGii toxin family protein [Clostridiales bacterium]|nr:nucleotidyl transferase AbiEii/AbiGii toxin family protein [Clostridiales bacterium]